jgi:type VI secretion system FHA domain protein
MRITLQIENVDRLESGGQVSYSCADRGFDIGRHEHLDWSLPDPHRVISGKHCEVRYEDERFVLYDISTNGTFLNGSPNRMDKAHALRAGDKLMIGDYIISVAMDQSETLSGGMAGAAQGLPAAQAWNSPQSAPSQASDPSWPAPHAPAPQAPYPAQEAGGPWDATPGMEGRHAPPSSAPGIGTPEDSVWGQNGHGWGSADPALYDPQPQNPMQEAARPAHADPLDHLAAQPHLATPFGSSPGPQIAHPETSSAPLSPAPVPPPSMEAPESTPEQPLFNMPDLGESETPASPAAPLAEKQADPTAGAASPFPEAPDWASSPDPVSSPVPDQAVKVHEEPVSASTQSVSEDNAEASELSSSQAGVLERPDKDQPSETNADFIKAFAEGAGIPESVLQGRDPEEFARELGSVLQDVTADMMGLLQARSQVKAMTRNANRTLISRSGNNALKFSPTAQSALQTMLSQNAEENGYLPMAKAMKAAFKDIQKHHVWTYAAMQKAAARFDETLSPKAIEEESKDAKSAFANQKAKFWERMQERWTSLSGAYDDGLVGVFTQYFTEGYEELSSQDTDQLQD